MNNNEKEIERLNGLNPNINVLKILRKNERTYVNCSCDACKNEFKQYKKIFDLNPVCPECVKKINKPKIQWTNESWKEEAQRIHPEYNLDETTYINSHTPITYICPKHGKRNVSPKNFIKERYKCPECKKEEEEKTKFDELLKILNEKFPEYTFGEIIKNKKKLTINVTCPLHGTWNTYPYNLLHGSKCPECSKKENSDKIRMTTEKFIESARKIHGEKYTYEKTDLLNKDFKGRVLITCPVHGEFWQSVNAHLRGAGCRKCASSRAKYSKEEIIEEFKKIHGNKYDYSQVEFVTKQKKVKIICHEVDPYTGKEHGEFWQSPKNHLKGWACKKCSGNYLDLELFKAKAAYIHNGKYNYDKITKLPKSNKDKVEIQCPEHGYFTQRIDSHLNGKGCPLCKTSHLERNINRILIENNIQFIYQYRRKEIFGKQSIDYFIPNKNIGIECQGEEHFIANFFKSRGIEYAENHLKEEITRDERKRVLCKDNGIRLIYFLEKKFEKFMKPGFEYYTNEDDLLNAIKS